MPYDAARVSAGAFLCGLFDERCWVCLVVVVSCCWLRRVVVAGVLQERQHSSLESDDVGQSGVLAHEVTKRRQTHVCGGVE